MDSIRENVRSCGDTDMTAGRGAGQLDWYRFALRYVSGQTVLDVGCGLGKGLDILQSQAGKADGLDTDPRLVRQGILTLPIQDVAAKSYDIVTSIDVVEHVAEPEAFVRHLARIARRGVFISTPNWTASRCQWPFHLREYTPREFVALLEGLGTVSLFKGTSSGSAVYPVRNPLAYYRFNDLRTWPPTSFLARCLNNLIPQKSRIHSSNAAWVQVA